MSDHGHPEGGRPCKGGKDQLVTLERRPPEYWKSPDELRGDTRPRGEFPGGLPAAGDHEGEANRRDFLSLVGFSMAAASVAACRSPEQRAIPLPVAAEDMVAGVANYYATTCGGCASACSLLVKQRDGRPIKIEGNEASELFGGATCATGQATVLSLYDDERLRGPLWQGRGAPWKDIDARVVAALEVSRSESRQVALVTGTITSPSMRAIITRWSQRFPRFRHVSYDAVSASAIRAASMQARGRALTPHYRFDRARVIVGLEADFLATWLSPVEFARQYARGRRPDGPASRHIHFEAGLSVTGGNADQRVPVAPSDLGGVAVALLARIARRAGVAAVDSPPDPVDAAVLDSVADQLWLHRGESLVVSGRNDVAVQLVVDALNELLGNIGKTVDLDRPSLQRQGDDAAMAELIAAMNRGEIHTLILHGVNPVYDCADAAGFARGLHKVALSVSTSDRRDETGVAVHAVCPDNHFLESWGDAEPIASSLSLTQPIIAPLFDTRAAATSLLRWIGDDTDPYTYLRAFWREQVFPRQSAVADFDAFWDASLERGVVDLGADPPGSAALVPAASQAAWRPAAGVLADESNRSRASRRDGRYELAFGESVALRDGRHANNPWLQELPDPVTKVTWGNVAAIAPALADRLGLTDGDVVTLATPIGAVAVPVFRQPGQEPRTLSIALGYGRKHVGKAGSGVGVDVFPLAPIVRGARSYWAAGATLTATDRHEDLATTQRHFSMEGRSIVLETTLAELAHGQPEAEALPDLWPGRPHGERSWGMAIDLDGCTGCSACVVACQAENNVPVVGKDQVQRQRSMHWIRIDRYYAGSEENPRSLHQPMMCQHCGHAPCETVCPVLATTTSSEGLNQQVYNRCIGTRYCANNCPYKVRRFNWYNYTDNPRFDFHMRSPVGRLVLNPDVTVRSRGVMEKCSLCVQRIHAGKNASVQSGRPLADGEIKTACQQVCPTDAIVFGDLKDPKSRVAQLVAGPRAYRVLDELGTRPNVAYLKKVRHG
ncbi:MAG TPA: Fe-S-cluster-containing hydrogenase [Kofleriaceae bacterium]|nr:Fe-S-cluster-containing hydrogenase [Kofleriaceae bacterium]